MSITIIICEVETMKEPLVITMAREYASGGSEIAQKVADLLGIPLYNKELITIAAKKSGLTEEAIAASETQRSGSLIYSLYMMGNTMPLGGPGVPFLQVQCHQGTDTDKRSPIIISEGGRPAEKDPGRKASRVYEDPFRRVQ